MIEVKLSNYIVEEGFKKSRCNAGKGWLWRVGGRRVSIWIGCRFKGGFRNNESNYFAQIDSSDPDGDDK